MANRIASIAVAAVVATLGLACQEEQAVHHTRPKQTTPATAAPATQAPVAEVSEESLKLFKSRCAVCHGEQGNGNGPGAAALNPKPRDYTNKEWQAKVTDDQIRSVIVMGGAALGKSPIMPASPDLQAKEDVVNGLVKIVRSFNGRGS